jgi:CubicO group peptidase (beta-lactamase class C family)
MTVAGMSKTGMRRQVWIAAVTGTVLLMGMAGATPAGAETRPGPGPETGPPTVSGADVRFERPARTLRYGDARRAGLVPEAVDRIVPDLKRYMEPQANGHPLYPGGVVLAAHRGTIVKHEAFGEAVRYSAVQNGVAVELPPDQRVPMRKDTIFDIASMTKLFTVVVAAQQAERGRLDFDALVTRYIPEFGQNGKEAVTVRQLMAHTSGLISWTNLYSAPHDEERMQRIYRLGLKNAPAGTVYEYSDLNLITLGEILKRITGKPLDELIATGITRPLGMTETGFRPAESLLPRIAATEYKPDIGRGMIRGVVHDENAWGFGGVAAHAGIFSTAHDLAIFAQMILNGGRYRGARILGEDWTRLIFTNDNAGLAPADAPRGLGFQLNQRNYMDALSSPVTAGHTGFTGTEVVIDPLSKSFLILLTNRVHPLRDWAPSITAARGSAARNLARAVPVRPAVGRTAWFSGQADNTTATLTAPLRAPSRSGRLSFRLWYDTEPTDVGALEATSDGGTTWTKVPLELRTGRWHWSTDGTFAGFSGRRWLTASAALPDGTTQVRWRYTTDRLYQGRGVYVDGVLALGRTGPLFIGELPHDAARFQPTAWTPSTT